MAFIFPPINTLNRKMKKASPLPPSSYCHRKRKSACWDLFFICQIINKLCHLSNIACLVPLIWKNTYEFCYHPGTRDQFICMFLYVFVSPQTSCVSPGLQMRVLIWHWNTLKTNSLVCREHFMLELFLFVLLFKVTFGFFTLEENNNRVAFNMHRYLEMFGPK